MTENSAAFSSQLGWFGRLDQAVYRLEVGVVVLALVAMSVLVFTDVVYQLVVSISEHGRWGLATGLLTFVGWIAFAATGDNRLDSEGEGEGDGGRRAVAVHGTGLRVVIALATVVGCVLVGVGMLHGESATVYRIVLFGLSLPVGRLLLRRNGKAVVVVFGLVVGFAIALGGDLPTGYAWSQSYSLVMLLWVGFLGASIAARKRRHLRVDLVRKLMSPAKLPWFNALSYTVAATFTGVVFYLGVLYLFGPESSYIRPIWDAPGWLPASLQSELVEGFPLSQDASLIRRAMQVFFAPSEPGEIPDWFKALAIPVSMALIMFRFLGHAVVFALMGLRGEEFVEDLGAH
jgi:TRAP-type C4-dicarboxylate transport system permease small subunit